MARRFLALFPSNNVSDPPLRRVRGLAERRAQSPDRIVPDEPTRAYGTKAVICATVDDGDHIELQLGWARNIVTGWRTLADTALESSHSNRSSLTGRRCVGSARPPRPPLQRGQRPARDTGGRFRVPARNRARA